jgi:1-acyl-sn-glycerol-3-phosphate acyltransferase
VVPVTIRGAREILRDKTWFPARGAVTVTIAPPIAARGTGWEAAVALREQARAAMLASCGEPALDSAVAVDKHRGQPKAAASA